MNLQKSTSYPNEQVSSRLYLLGTVLLYLLLAVLIGLRIFDLQDPFSIGSPQDYEDINVNLFLSQKSLVNIFSFGTLLIGLNLFTKKFDGKKILMILPLAIGSIIALLVGHVGNFNFGSIGQFYLYLMVIFLGLLLVSYFIVFCYSQFGEVKSGKEVQFLTSIWMQIIILGFALIIVWREFLIAH
jgi:hypothetical protein